VLKLCLLSSSRFTGIQKLKVITLRPHFKLVGLMVIKVNSPFIGDEEVEAVAKVLRSGMLAQGAVVREFEERFAEYVGVKHAVTLSNGTIALYAALKAIGVGGGDEVIVPDFTFFATASAVVLAGGRPVFADIDLETYTIDPASVERLVSDRTKAVIPVHLYGHPAMMDELLSIAREHNIVVIEDCAQAHGAEFRGMRVGSLGTVNAFSFYATKNLTMGEGGAITTDSDAIAEFVRLLRNHGQTRRYYHERLGWNFRITNIQAAIGLEQLRKLEAMNRRRREIARMYVEGLEGVDGLRLPVEKPWAKHVYHQFTIWVENGRDRLAKYLRDNGVQVSIHYPAPLHEQPVFRGRYGGGECVNSSLAARHVLSIPMHPGLSDEEVETVIKLIRRFFTFESR